MSSVCDVPSPHPLYPLLGPAMQAYPPRLPVVLPPVLSHTRASPSLLASGSRVACSSPGSLAKGKAKCSSDDFSRPPMVLSYQSSPGRAITVLPASREGVSVALEPLPSVPPTVLPAVADVSSRLNFSLPNSTFRGQVRPSLDPLIKFVIPLSPSFPICPPRPSPITSPLGLMSVSSPSALS